MKTTVELHDFRDAFRQAGRTDSFSYAGLKALYEWLEELADDRGTEYELDVVALCGEFSEYDYALSCVEDCGYDCPFSEREGCQGKEDFALEWLEENTLVIEFDGGIIIQDFQEAN